MNIFSRYKIVLSLVILALATASVFAPNVIFLLGVVIVLSVLFFRLPLIGIIATLLAAFAGEFTRIEISGISFLALDLIAALTIATWLLRKLLKKEKLMLDRVSGSLFAFWIVALLSLLFGCAELSFAEFQFSLLHLLRFFGVSGLLFVARDCTKKDTPKISNALIFGGVLFALIGFALFQALPDFTEAGLTELGWDPHIGRLTSTFLDPNFAGGAFAILLAIVGGRFLREKKIERQSFMLLIAGILGLALILTFSRSALLATGFAGLVLGIFGDRRILIAIVVVAVLGIASSPRLAERIGELTQSIESFGGESQQVLDPTARLRVDSWDEGWRIFKEKPILGTGFGTYTFHQHFTSEDSHAASGSDASLLNVAATTGILGFVVFGIFLWNLTVVTFREKNWGFLAALAGLLVHSIFVNSLFFAPIAAIFFITAGIKPIKQD